MNFGVLPRAAFDCVVFVQAVLRPNGPAARCLVLAAGSAFQIVVCDAVVREVRTTLGRGSIRRKYPSVTDAAVDTLLDTIRHVSLHVADPPAHVQLPRDPKDEVYVNLAVETGARYLVTRDNDLLDLMHTKTPDGEAFRERFPA